MGWVTSSTSDCEPLDTAGVWAAVRVGGFACAIVDSWGLGSKLLVKCVWSVGSCIFFSYTRFFNSLRLAYFPCFTFGFEVLFRRCNLGLSFSQSLVKSSELGAAGRELVVHIICSSIDPFELLFDSPRLHALL